jgi:hypothetical protein
MGPLAVLADELWKTLSVSLFGDMVTGGKSYS